MDPSFGQVFHDCDNNAGRALRFEQVFRGPKVLQAYKHLEIVEQEAM